jgi:hypothetical protein
MQVMSNRYSFSNIHDFSQYINQTLDSVDKNSKSDYFYKPDLKDLWNLYRLTRVTKALSVLEIGSGWSTLAFTLALSANKEDYEQNTRSLRHPNKFQLLTVEAEKKFIKQTLKRIPIDSMQMVKPWISKHKFTQLNGQICTRMRKIPTFTADIFYLDGPDCGEKQITGSFDGFKLNYGDEDKVYGLPMSGDLLMLEPYFWPGSLIVVDGRAANVNFLRNNLRRNWRYRYLDSDQHILYLDEQSWGKFSQNHIFFRYEGGAFNIENF